MRRAELTFGLLIIAVIFAAVTLLTVILIIKVKYGVDDSMNERQQCRLSVVAHNALHYQTMGKDLINPIDFDCSRRIVVIKRDHVEVNGKKKSFYDGVQDRMISSYDELTPEIVNAVATDELAGCWYQFLQGKSDFLGDKFASWGKNTRSCFICSELQFDKGLKLPLSGKPEPLIDYIKRAKVRKAYLLEQDGPRDAESFIFNDDALCGAYYKKWTDSSFLGLRNPQITESSSCQERYIYFWSGKGTNSPLARLIGALRVSDKTIHSILPFGDLNVTINPQTPADEYFILFMAEKGSWYGKTIRPFIEKLFRLTDEELKKFEGTGTYVAWIIPADQMNSDVCNAGYFA